MEEMNKDNWLMDEKAREAKISIWEMYDNRKVVYDEHRENCERQDTFNEHMNVHNYQNRSRTAVNQNQKAVEIIVTTIASIIVFTILFIIFLFA